MITYNNNSTFRIMFQLTGSVLPKCIGVSIMPLALGVVLSLLRVYDMTDDVFGKEDYIRDPFACQVVSIVIGYLLVVRTNQALERWMTGISEIQTMLSKWTDAYTCVNGFWAGKTGSHETMERILHCRIRIAHWFSLMSCVAFATLRAGREVDIQTVPIKALFGPPPRPDHKQTFGDANSPDTRSVGVFDKANNVERLQLHVLHPPTAEEVAILGETSDKVNTICLWIIQATIMEIRAGRLDAPAPILSRIYQELSAGMLGYHQAHKVAMVPFPFPFAQMVTYCLLMLYLIIPFHIDVFTRSTVLTPVISWFIPLAYHGLNQIAVELEEPFGIDTNDVDIEERHERFIAVVNDVLKQSMVPPARADDTLEREILEGYRKRTAAGIPRDLEGIESNFLSKSYRRPTYPRAQENPQGDF